MTAKRLRILFQGGGAKLAYMLAAAEVIEELADRYDIEIVEAGGVSAGALAATALAGGSSVKEVRQSFVQKGNTLANEIANLPKLKIGMKTGLALVKILNGHPLINERVIKDFISETFRSSTEDGLLRGLTIFFSDLRESSIERRRYSDTRSFETKDLYDDLFRSIGLPFVFTNFNQGPYTDGGICGNLPVTSFLEHDDESRLITVHFSPEKQEFDNAARYSLSLLGGSINSHVNSSLQASEEYGGQNWELPSNGIGTFDFVDALNFAKNTTLFEGYKKNLESSLNDHIDRLFSDARIIQVEERTYKSSLITHSHDLIRKSHPAKKTRVLQCHLHGKSFASKVTQERDDRIYYVSEYEPLSPLGILGLLHGLPSGDDKIGAMESRLHELPPNGIERPLRARSQILSFRETETNKIRNRVQFFLEEPVKSNVRLTVSFDFSIFDELNTHGVSCSMSEAIANNDAFEKLWLLALPGRFEDYSLVDWAAANPQSLPEGRSRAVLESHLKHAKGKSKGNALSESGAAALINRHCKAEFGDNTTFLGFRVDTFEPGSSAGFVLLKN